jgi:hypothetical protein
VYNLLPGETVQAAVPSDKAISSASIPVTATREDNKIRISVAGVTVKKVKIFESGIQSKSVAGGTSTQSSESSLLIDVEPNVDEIIVEL